jgi:hypothetical protein
VGEKLAQSGHPAPQHLEPIVMSVVFTLAESTAHAELLF